MFFNALTGTVIYYNCPNLDNGDQPTANGPGPGAVTGGFGGANAGPGAGGGGFGGQNVDSGGGGFGGASKG